LLCYILLSVVGVLFTAVGFVLTRAYTEWGTHIIIIVVAGSAAALSMSVLAVWKLGPERFLKLAIELLLAGVLVFTVLAIGGCPTWTWVVMECAVALGVILWLLRMLLAGKLTYVKTPLNVLLILLVLYIFFQVVPLPAGVLRGFQSNTLRAYTLGPPNVATGTSRRSTAATSSPGSPTATARPPRW